MILRAGSCCFALVFLMSFSTSCAVEDTAAEENASARASAPDGVVQDGSAQDNAAQKQSAEQFSREIKLDYLLSLPAEYESQESWPLVLFLHGAGERGSDVNQVKVHGPPKLVESGEEFPFILVSPQCPMTVTAADGQQRRGWWDPVSLTALLDEVIAKHNVDQNRVYVTGLSMGGFGTWALAAHTPHRFAAIAPICGGGDPTTCNRLTNMGVWVFHGGQDRVVPLDRSQRMVDALKEAGVDLNFTIYEEAGHDSWTATYDNPKLYEWLLSHSLDSDE